MKSIEIEFELGDTVLIHELQTRGLVVQIAYSRKGVTYELDYWWRGKRENCWLPGPELRTIEVPKP